MEAIITVTEYLDKKEVRQQSVHKYENWGKGFTDYSIFCKLNNLTNACYDIGYKTIQGGGIGFNYHIKLESI